MGKLYLELYEIDPGEKLIESLEIPVNLFSFIENLINEKGEQFFYNPFLISESQFLRLQDKIGYLKDKKFREYDYFLQYLEE